MIRTTILQSESAKFLESFSYDPETGEIRRRGPTKAAMLRTTYRAWGYYWVTNWGHEWHAGAVAWLLYHNEVPHRPVEYVHRVEPPRLDNLYLYLPHIPVYQQTVRKPGQVQEQALRVALAREQQAAFRSAGRVDLSYLDPLG